MTVDDDAVDPTVEEDALQEVGASGEIGPDEGVASDLSESSESSPASEPAGDEAEASTGDGTAEAALPDPPADGLVGQLLAEVTAERDRYLDALQRTQADFENFRKRSFKQQGDAIDHATGRLAEELLPVLDACDAAAQHGVDEVDAIVSALMAALERAGLERIAPEGAPFDPNTHDAVLHEPADEPEAEPTVAEVLRPGYSWKGRVIRPAMVKVKG